MIVLLFLTGCSISAVVDENGDRHTISDYFLTEEGAVETTQYLAAKLTGSIYEIGDQITVFGACLTARDQPVDANVSITVYYPNGTLAINTTNVTNIQTGYWFYSDTMSAVKGTYLTVWTCRKGGEQAIAFGEWQNPFWVNRLQNMTDILANLSVYINVSSFSCDDLDIDNTTLCEMVKTGFNNTNMTLQEILSKLDSMNMTLEQVYTIVQQNNVSINQVIDMLVDINSSIVIGFNNMNNSFQVVYDKIDNINVSLIIELNETNILIEYGACVANRSVDRTDSYLARIAQTIALAVDAPMSGYLNWTSLSTLPVVRRTWRVRTYVINEYDNWGYYDDNVRCNATIYDEGSYTNYSMEWIPGRMSIFSDTDEDDETQFSRCQGLPRCTSDMKQKGYFEYEYIWEDDTDGDWSILCFYNPSVEDLTNYTVPTC